MRPARMIAEASDAPTRDARVLTRLKVTGFENLVDVRFGSFTCNAGVSGVGKWNLFDGIRFLSALADRPFLEAAKCMYDEAKKTGDMHSLFHRVANVADLAMEFEAEMIVPEKERMIRGSLQKPARHFSRTHLQ